MSLETFPSDPGLPQLKIATDSALMLQVFRKHLCPFPGRSYHIQDCVLSWMRYMRGTRCTLQYTLSLVEGRTGHKQSQWVTGVIYPKDRAERIFQKLRAAHPVQEATEAFQTFEPVAFIPDLRMLVQVYPYDRRLPALPLLMTGRSPELEPLLLSQFGPGEWQTEMWNIEAIRYRVGARAVLRFTVQAQDTSTGKRGEKRFYVKVLRSEEGERSHQILQTLWSKTDTVSQGFIAGGRPIAYLSKLHTLVQGEANGTSLQQVLLQGRDPIVAVRKAALALAIFNQGNVDTKWYYSPEDEISNLKWAVAMLQFACPQMAVALDRIITAISTGLGAPPPGLIHGDLKADHIFMDGECLSLIDLDSFARADPVLDPARLLADLAKMKIRFPTLQNQLRIAAQSFAEEYFLHVPKTWRSRLPLRYAGAALKVAVGFFRRQEPDWPGKVRVMVKEAEDAISGKLW